MRRCPRAAFHLSTHCAGPEGPKDQHLLRVLRMLLPLVVPPATAVHAAAADDEGELLDACRGLLAAAAVHRAPGFERVGAGVWLGSWLRSLHTGMCECR